MNLIITAVVCLIAGGAGMLIYLANFTQSTITFKGK